MSFWSVLSKPVGLWIKEFNISYTKFNTVKWRKDLSARHSETINSTCLLISTHPWLPRPVRGRTAVEGHSCVYVCIAVCTHAYVCVVSPG